MRTFFALAAACLLSPAQHHSNAFAPQSLVRHRYRASSEAGTQLFAIGVLARKAKEMDVRKYCEGGVEEDVLAKLQQIKDGSGSAVVPGDEPGPLQQALTKRKGTISIVAEYKRKLDGAGYIDEVVEPEVLSPVFREFGASACAVMADERMGGCTYNDLKAFVAEQEGARGDMPGPLPVVSSDLIVDEIQIARSAAAGAGAVTVTHGVVGPEKVRQFLRDAKAVGIEVIVNVATGEEAQDAVDAGAGIVCVAGVEGADAKLSVVENLSIPDGSAVCTVANILAKDNKMLEEVEEAWMCRDNGFNAVWVSDALYKGGSDPVEHPGAIINSMRSKSSVKWASPKARSGKGEGAREYLGDILM